MFFIPGECSPVPSRRVYVSQACPNPLPLLRGRQALKTERTRARLIGATIGLIRERGFAAATAATSRGGPESAGARPSISSAPRSRSWRGSSPWPTSGSSDDERAGIAPGPALARARESHARMWAHYQGDYYRVSLEILRATRGVCGARALAWEQRQGRAHVQVCARCSMTPDSAMRGCTRRSPSRTAASRASRSRVCSETRASRPPPFATYCRGAGRHVG